MEPVYLLRITAQFKTQAVNKVKDNVAVPDHEKEEKEIRMEKVRQDKSTSIFFK